jgi:ribosomal protein L11 methyltransferase
MDGGLGIDIDSCARVEAAVNVKNNGLEDRITISGQSLDTIDQRFTMVLANLRYPSLKRLYPRLTEVTAQGGVLILSGIKNDEVADLLEVYTKCRFKCLWSVDELGWTGVVLEKMLPTLLPPAKDGPTFRRKSDPLDRQNTDENFRILNPSDFFFFTCDEKTIDK